MHSNNLSLLFVGLLSILLSISSSLVIASSHSHSNTDENFFKSLGEATFNLLKDTNLKSVQGIDNLFDSLPDKNSKTHEKHYKDENGFDCHETVSTSFGTFGTEYENTEGGGGGGKGEREKENEEEKNLFRIQKRSKSNEEDEKSKVPAFVVKDGFFDLTMKEDDWF